MSRETNAIENPATKVLRAVAIVSFGAAITACGAGTATQTFGGQGSPGVGNPASGATPISATAMPGSSGSGTSTPTPTNAPGSSPSPSNVVSLPGSSVATAVCSAGDSPEDGVQGEVPKADRNDGRSALGYRCNMKRIGQYQGSGAGITGAAYAHCAYMGTFYPGDTTAPHPGVNVIDVSNPSSPQFSTTLTSPAMLSGTWESLKVNAARGLLAATGDPTLTGALTFDIYDVKTDCAHPKLLNAIAGTNFTAPIDVTSHEGGFSPDGNTYYATSSVGGYVTAIDVTNPANPQVLFSGSTITANHGFSITPDGNTMYGVSTSTAGIQILDISDIQARKASPQIRQISSLAWSDGLLTQMTIPFTSNAHAYLFAADEANTGGVRLIDIDNASKPYIAREYRLQIDQPSEKQARAIDTGGDGAFGYDSHYCTINSPVNPTRLACGYWQSGIRLFDITDVMNPAEIAYYNPPAQTGLNNEVRLVNSPHAVAVLSPQVLDPDSLAFSSVTGAVKPDMTTDWCASPPTFYTPTQLWVTCSDNGFMVLQLEI